MSDELTADWQTIRITDYYSHSITAPSSWAKALFSEICQVIGGSQPPKTTFINEPREGYIRLIQIRDYKTDKFATYIPVELAKRFCNKEDIMIGRYGPPIFQILRGLEGAYNVALMKAVPHSRFVDKEFLYYFLQTSNLFNYIAAASLRTAGQDGVRKEHLDNYPVFVPPLNEQKRIVAKIEELRDRLHRSKQALEAVPELCDRFRQSVLAAAFRGDLTADWREENLSSEWERAILGDVIKGKPRNGYSPKPVDYPTKVKSLTLSATTSGVFKPEYFKYINEDIEPSSHLWLSPNDILIQRSNTLEYVGTSAIYDGSWGEFIYPDLMMKVQVLEEKVKPEFIHYLLSSRETREYFKNNATGTAGNMPKINQQIVMNTPVVVPSIEEQQQIVSCIRRCFKAIDHIQHQYQNAKSRIEHLNQSILAKAFRGELVEQDPNDETASVLLDRIRAERQAQEGKKSGGAKGKRKKASSDQLDLPGVG